MLQEMLSVIIPIYNVEEYLHECVSSVINQTYQNLEIILVDDGSTDNSGKICDNYEAQDKRVKVIHKNNGGLISARYTGLCHAQAEYVTFVDGDDFIDKNMYNDLMEIISCCGPDMITSGCYRYWEIDDSFKDICCGIGQGLYTYSDMEEKVFPIMFWEEKINKWAVDPSLCMKIFKKKFLIEQYEKIKNYSFYYGEDSAVTYPAMLQMDSIYISHKCYYYHRQPMRGSKKGFILADNFLTNLMELYNYLRCEFDKDIHRESLFRQLDFFYIKSTQLLARRYPEIKTSVGITREWMFPFAKVKCGSRIVLYGAGTIGKQYWNQLNKTGYCKEVLWVDKNACLLNDNDVQLPEKASPDKYDLIIIAIMDKGTSQKVMDNMILEGWEKEKIIIPDF